MSNEKTWQPKEPVLILRTVGKDGKAYGGFQWPESGYVECPDFKPTKECGNGFHGLLWAEGDWSLLSWAHDAIWQVVEAESSEIVQMGNKVKFPRCNVLATGNSSLIATIFVKAPWFDAAVKSKTLGDNGGSYAQIGSSGNFARIGSSGDFARIGSSGDYAQIGSSGNYAQIRATGKNAVVACAASPAFVTLGENGCVAIPWHDGERTRFAIGYVGENLKPNTAYRVNGKGEFEEATV